MDRTHAVALAATLIGLLIVVQGVFGLAVPDLFAGLVRAIQQPPVLYVAAAVRILFGVVLICAAPASRAPRTLLGLGGLIVIGGLLTPFVGVQFARAVLGWWAEGAAVVRAWAGVALALGLFIVFATAQRRRATS